MTHHRFLLLSLAGMSLLLTACGSGEREYDATGTFEATETTLSAEQGGTLLSFTLTEGDAVAAGQQVGLIDTTQLWLSIQQLLTSKQVYESQKPDVQTQLAAMRQQLAKAQQEEQRYRELVADGAAPAKMLDDATSQVLVLQRQLNALSSQLNTQVSTLNSQLSTVDAQLTQLYDQLARCHITVPLDATVIEKYAEQGELVTPGRPLAKLADTSHMYLRAYVTSQQLQNIRIGQNVTVFADYGDGQKKEYQGTVTWISSQSEFTPKTILTDDERADLVYAVKIGVENDGFVKIGMYGEVKL
ncbi:MAG: HlyD family efflux transporter periplasmic adaptor subunit [Prevotella sp.]|nr:HlyD family efflux transporter periplasmic adaptor subunit [Prevotella sp.]